MFSLASFAGRDGRAWPGAPAAAARAGLSRRRYLHDRDLLAQRGLIVVEELASGRGRASTVALPFAAEGPWWEGEINAELFEAVLSRTRTRGPARQLLAAMAALADADGVVRGVSSEELRAAAGVADRTYRRARRELLGSGELALLSSAVGRGNTNVWQVRISAETPVPSPAVRSQRRVEDLHLTTTLLARRVGRSRSDLAHTVRLLELPDEAIELLSNGALTKGHGKALLSEADRYRRRELAEREAQPGWSVRALEAEIARASPPLRRPIDPHPDQIAAAAKLHELLARATGCHIEARPYRIGYQLILDQDAVDRLAEILGPAAGADQ